MLIQFFLKASKFNRGTHTFFCSDYKGKKKSKIVSLNLFLFDFQILTKL